MGNFRCFDCWNCVHPLDLHVVYHFFSIIRGFEIIVTQPRLSIIIPAYNEENRLPNTLEQVFNFIQKQKYLTEVLIVENGSSDRTGMLRAVGQYRFMCDADLSMPIAEINRFLPPALGDFDIAIASREAPGSVRYDEPGYRHWGGRGTNLLIRLLALPGLHDTQCGFKMFRSDIAEDVFRYQTITNWSFDIELLYIARLRGYHIREIPIPWYFNAETKLNPIRDAFYMVFDILTIRRNAFLKIYDPQPAS